MDTALPSTESSSNEPSAPRVFRAMKRDETDHLPVVGTANSSQLGARLNTDVSVDDNGHVVRDHRGMSVAPSWRQLPFNRIPRRLRGTVEGAIGSNNTFCFAMGKGSFARGDLATGLELIPDDRPHPARHGVVAPTQVVSFAEYQACLESTRQSWTIDET